MPGIFVFFLSHALFLIGIYSPIIWHHWGTFVQVQSSSSRASQQTRYVFSWRERGIRMTQMVSTTDLYQDDNKY